MYCGVEAARGEEFLCHVPAQVVEPQMALEAELFLTLADYHIHVVGRVVGRGIIYRQACAHRSVVEGELIGTAAHFIEVISCRFCLTGLECGLGIEQIEVGEAEYTLVDGVVAFVALKPLGCPVFDSIVRDLLLEAVVAVGIRLQIGAGPVGGDNVASGDVE